MKGFRSQVILVSISGIPGVGKSTAIKELQEKKLLEKKLPSCTICYVHEPSDEWIQNGWLSAFYDDPVKNALAFQLLVFETHVKAVQNEIEKQEKLINSKRETLDVGEFRVHTKEKDTIICIVERSMWDQLLFWRVQKSTKIEDDAYMHIWRRWNAFIPPVSIIFYCKTSDIQKTMRRVERRARKEETNIHLKRSGPSENEQEDVVVVEAGGLTLSYQTALEKKHTEWFGGVCSNIQPREEGGEGIPCVQVDMDLPYHDDLEALETLGDLMVENIKMLL